MQAAAGALFHVGCPITGRPVCYCVHAAAQAPNLMRPQDVQRLWQLWRASAQERPAASQAKPSASGSAEQSAEVLVPCLYQQINPYSGQQVAAAEAREEEAAAAHEAQLAASTAATKAARAAASAGLAYCPPAALGVRMPEPAAERPSSGEAAATALEERSAALGQELQALHARAAQLQAQQAELAARRRKLAEEQAASEAAKANAMAAANVASAGQANAALPGMRPQKNTTAASGTGKLGGASGFLSARQGGSKAAPGMRPPSFHAGALLRLSDIQPGLVGALLMVLWPDTGQWYLGQVQRLEAGSARGVIHYMESNEEEEANFQELIRGGEVAWAVQQQQQMGGAGRVTGAEAQAEAAPGGIGSGSGLSGKKKRGAAAPRAMDAEVKGSGSSDNVGKKVRRHMLLGEQEAGCKGGAATAWQPLGGQPAGASAAAPAWAHPHDGLLAGEELLKEGPNAVGQRVEVHWAEQGDVWMPATVTAVAAAAGRVSIQYDHGGSDEIFVGDGAAPCMRRLPGLLVPKTSADDAGGFS